MAAPLFFQSQIPFLQSLVRVTFQVFHHLLNLLETHFLQGIRSWLWLFGIPHSWALNSTMSRWRSNVMSDNFCKCELASRRGYSKQMLVAFLSMSLNASSVWSWACTCKGLGLTSGRLLDCQSVKRWPIQTKITPKTTVGSQIAGGIHCLLSKLYSLVIILRCGMIYDRYTHTQYTYT